MGTGAHELYTRFVILRKQYHCVFLITMGKRIYISILVLMTVCGNISAKGGIGNWIGKLGTFIDSMSVSGVDRRYIDSPEKPWQLIVQGNVSQSDLKMKAVLDGKAMFAEEWGDIFWEPRIKTAPSVYTGIWAGYRGYGLGYSKNVGGDNGSIFKLGAMGGAYGVNFRIHKFQTDEPILKLKGYMPEWEEIEYPYSLTSPIKVRVLSFDGYYLFNGKHFSYAAAYDQSVIQKRSAGSFMVGAMYYHSTIAYDEGYDADFIFYMNDIGRMKQYQVSLGGGYAYNYVPCRGLLISAMGMLMLTAYNRLDVWCYNSRFREDEIRIHRDSDSGFDDVFDLDDEETMKKYYSLWPLEGHEKTITHSRVIPIIDARLSVTYNLGDCFFNANAVLNDYRFKHERNSGSLTEWQVNASVGLRL